MGIDTCGLAPVIREYGPTVFDSGGLADGGGLDSGDIIAMLGR
jgi:hypothetical protein